MSENIQKAELITRLKRNELSVELFRAAKYGLRNCPTDAFYYKLLAELCMRRGHSRFAEGIYQHSLQNCLPDAELHSNYAVNLMSIGSIQAALDHLQTAIALSPNNGLYRFNLAVALEKAGKLDAALQIHYALIKATPPYLPALGNLGEILYRSNQVVTGIELIKSLPEKVRSTDYALSVLGRLHLALGDSETAVTHYRNAVTCNFNASNLARYANALLENNQPLEALRVLIGNLKTLDKNADLFFLIALALQRVGKFFAALKFYKQSLKLNGKNQLVFTNLIFLYNFHSTYSGERILYEINKLNRKIHFPNLGNKQSSSIAQGEAKYLGRKANRKRIGFLSGDFRNHPVGYLLLPLVERLDGGAYYLVGISTAQVEDETTKALKAKLNTWINITGLEDPAAETNVSALDLDYIIDLSGCTRGNRLALFKGHRLARHHISWLGYAGTLGLDKQFSVIADPIIAPLSEEHCFSEQILRMRTCYLCAHGFSQARVKVIRERYDKTFRFANFGNYAKITNCTINEWSKILKVAKLATLRLQSKEYRDIDLVKRIRQKFLQNGIDETRLEIRCYETYEKYLDSYNDVDLILDTTPYPGATTTIEALWMGVPVLSMRGSRFLSRNCETIQVNSNLPFNIACDTSDYLRRAIAIYETGTLSRVIREERRLRFSESNIADPVRYTEEFSDLLEGLSERSK